jgi:hypothetical protein
MGTRGGGRGPAGGRLLLEPGGRGEPGRHRPAGLQPGEQAGEVRRALRRVPRALRVSEGEQRLRAHRPRGVARQPPAAPRQLHRGYRHHPLGDPRAVPAADLRSPLPRHLRLGRAGLLRALRRPGVERRPQPAPAALRGVPAQPEYIDPETPGYPADPTQSQATASIVDPQSQKVYFTGITDVQQHASSASAGRPPGKPGST